MNQPPNSPESLPPSSEQIFPQLEAEKLNTADEQLPNGAERQAEEAVERDVTDAQIVLPTAQPAPLPTPTQPTPVPPASTPATAADDVDVIEKAWVEKAKQIIKETKDDPRAQEQAFEQLQIEYHKKRYGRDIKATR
ncbi:MAG: hypothetical protein WD467_01265 [Candidatus Saccharimonadales bacterium]